jgi:2-oxoglutarate dehydrogenase E2 component (dihydrolipoamide succinyltransferase)
MSISIVVPELGESILEATIAHWLKREGERVAQGEPLVELETDKVNLEIPALQSGVLKRIERKDQEDVKVGDVIGVIEDAPEPASGITPSEVEKVVPQKKPDSQTETEASTSAVSQPPASNPPPVTTPVAQRLVRDLGVDVSRVTGSGPGGRVTKTDVETFLQQHPKITQPQPTPQPATLPPLPIAPLTSEMRREERRKMSRRRRTIAQRLIEVQQTAAILTTFNEVDMSQVMDLRKRHNESFLARYGVKLGITSFFVKATIGALKTFPLLNAEVLGDEILVKYYYDIGVAVGSPEGLVVPVLRDADRMSFAEIEGKIAELVLKTDEGKLTLEDLRGGTFSITNGGVFGSLMSTPILTPPQVGILGLHKIEKRPVVVDEQVSIRPMMYVALSYDHRIVDGREAVQFLVKVKELIEDPEALLLEG